MTARTALACLVLVPLAALTPRASAQESDDADKPVSSAGPKEKVDPALSRFDSIFDKTTGAVTSLERCVNMRSDLARQLPPAASASKASAGKAAFVEVPNPSVARAIRLTEDCGADVPIEQALKNKDLTRLDNENRIPAAANAYFLCVAIAKKDIAVCDPLGAIADFEPGTYWISSTHLCQGYYRRLNISRALITGDPQARELCLKRGPGSAAARAPECDLLMKVGADLKGICEKAAPAGPEREVCERNAASHWGLAPRCDPADISKNPKPAGSQKLVSPAILEQCLASDAAAAFRKAQASGSLEGCGGDGLCMAMMGAGVKACQGYAAQVQTAKREYCPRAGSTLSTAQSAEMEKDLKAWEAETKRKSEDLKRKAEDDKRAMEAASTRRSQTDAQAATIRSKMNQMDSVCAKLEVEGNEAMRSLFSSFDGVEPKSLPGLRRRVQRYNTLKSRWNTLLQKLHPQTPRAKR